MCAPNSHHSSDVNLVVFCYARNWFGPEGDISQNHACTEVEERCQAVVSVVLETHTDQKNKTLQHFSRSFIRSFSHSDLFLLQQQPSRSCSYDLQLRRWPSRGKSWRSRRQRQTSPSPEASGGPRGSTPPGSTPDHRTPAKMDYDLWYLGYLFVPEWHQTDYWLYQMIAGAARPLSSTTRAL